MKTFYRVKLFATHMFNDWDDEPQVVLNLDMKTQDAPAIMNERKRVGSFHTDMGSISVSHNKNRVAKYFQNKRKRSRKWHRRI